MHVVRTSVRLGSFIRFFGNGSYFKIEHGLPSAAKFIRAWIEQDNGSQVLWLVYEHPSFDEVLEESLIPETRIMVTEMRETIRYI